MDGSKLRERKEEEEEEENFLALLLMVPLHYYTGSARLYSFDPF